MKDPGNPIPDFRPLGDYVLLTMEDDHNVAVQSESVVLYKPETSKEKPQHAYVLATGPECDQVIVGQRVITVKYAGKPIQLDGKKFQYVRQGEIVAIVGGSTEIA